MCSKVFFSLRGIITDAVHFPFCILSQALLHLTSSFTKSPHGASVSAAVAGSAGPSVSSAWG